MRQLLCSKSKVTLRLKRNISVSAPVLFSTVGSVLSSTEQMIPSVTSDTLVRNAAELMTERKIPALAVVRDSKLCGIFTEREYCKVLKSNQTNASIGDALQSSQVKHVARSHDDVSQCIHELMRKNLTVVPVVDENEKYLGTLSLSDLSKQFFESQRTSRKTVDFAEPSVFPESGDSEMNARALFDQLRQDMEKAHMNTTEKNHLVEELERMEHVVAEEKFTASSVFPDLSRTEDKILQDVTKTQPKKKIEADVVDKTVQGNAEWLCEKRVFSEPADFPEVGVVNDVVEKTKR